MIRIFRAIRARLLKQGKITGYLAYAVGEIFLVVVGILIALQVNNWNELRKIRASEQKILESIRLSLIADSILYYRMQNRLADANHSIELLLSQPPMHDSLSIHFVKSLNGIYLNVRTSAYDQLHSLGLERIQNTTLRDSLVRHYDGYVKVDVERIERNLTNYINEIQGPFYHEHFLTTAPNGDIAASSFMPKDYDALIVSPGFHSVLVDKWHYNKQSSSIIIARLQRKTRVLLGQIEAELAK